MGPGPPRSNDREGVLRSNGGDGLVGVRSTCPLPEMASMAILWPQRFHHIEQKCLTYISQARLDSFL